PGGERRVEDRLELAGIRWTIGGIGDPGQREMVVFVPAGVDVVQIAVDRAESRHAGLRVPLHRSADRPGGAEPTGLPRVAQRGRLPIAEFGELVVVRSTPGRLAVPDQMDRSHAV